MNRGLARRANLWAGALLVCAVLPALACQGSEEDAAAGGSEPAKVEPVEGSDGLNRVVLTAEAADRLDVQTMPVEAVEGAGGGQTVVPYAALVYEPSGETWVYTSPEPLTFVRHRIAVVSIEGDSAVLSAGPPVGTKVVTVGVAELFGAENGIGADDGH